MEDGSQAFTTNLANFVFTPAETTENSTTNNTNDLKVEQEDKLQKRLLELRKAADLAERELAVQKEIENAKFNDTKLQNLMATFDQEEVIKFEAKLREQEGTQQQLLTLQEIRAAAARQEIEDRINTNEFLKELDNELTQLQIDLSLIHISEPTRPY